MARFATVCLALLLTQPGCANSSGSPQAQPPLQQAPSGDVPGRGTDPVAEPSLEGDRAPEETSQVSEPSGAGEGLSSHQLLPAEEAATDDVDLSACETPPNTPTCVVAAHDPAYAASAQLQQPAAGNGDATDVALPELRARERQALIDALDALGHETRAIAHVRQFVDDYPRDRRSNGYRIRLSQLR